MDDFSCFVRIEMGSLCELMSSSAIIQGDSLGPTEHKLTINELLKEVDRMLSADFLYYLDDGKVAGPITEVASVCRASH